MRVVATAKGVRTAARKARLVAKSVEGLRVAEALVVLDFTPRYAAVEIAKVIKSAAANAEHNFNLDVSTLRVERVEVEGATIMKRIRPKPRGMAGSIFKRTSHLRAYVTDEPVADGVARRSVVKMPRPGLAVPTAPSADRPARAPRRRAKSTADATTPAIDAAADTAAAATKKPAKADQPKAAKPKKAEAPKSDGEGAPRADATEGETE